MSITFRNNLKITDFQEDYHRIRSFLLKLDNPNYGFGRWDWMITQLWCDISGLPKIAVWEHDGNIVALAANDCRLGESFFCVFDEYSFLKKEMLVYAKDAFSKDGKYRALIHDKDIYFQNVAAEMGFVATDEREHDAIYHIDTDKIHYTLPEGFRLTDFSKDYELIKASLNLPADKTVEGWERMWLRPNVDLNLKINIIAPNGKDVAPAVCGMTKNRNTHWLSLSAQMTNTKGAGLQKWLF